MQPCAEAVRSLRRVSRYWLAVRGLLTALPLAPTGAPFALAGASPTLLALPKVRSERSPTLPTHAAAASCATRPAGPTVTHPWMR